jgi:tripartite-type tricarboxylate transporter receptor subunit TctC
VLAVSTGTRSKQAPNVPTMAEAGVTGSVPVFPWFGLTLPSGTPAAIVTKLNTVLNQVLATEETIKFLATSGWEPIGGSVRDFEQMQAKEIEAWAHIGRVAKIEAQ